jgi:hypothetical protein
MDDFIRSFFPTGIDFKKIQNFPLNNFYMFSKYHKIKVLNTFEVTIENTKIYFCFVEYELAFTPVRAYSIFPTVDKSIYIFGVLELTHSLGNFYVRPKFFQDWITDLFKKSNHFKTSSSKFNLKYRLNSNKDTLLKSLDSSGFFRYLASLEGLELEVIDKICLFRIGEKSVNHNSFDSIKETGINLFNRLYLA